MCWFCCSLLLLGDRMQHTYYLWACGLLDHTSGFRVPVITEPGFLDIEGRSWLQHLELLLPSICYLLSVRWFACAASLAGFYTSTCFRSESKCYPISGATPIRSDYHLSFDRCPVARKIRLAWIDQAFTWRSSVETVSFTTITGCYRRHAATILLMF